MEVTIAKALKIKCRLVSLSKQTGKNIEENNSIVEGGTPKLNVQDEYCRYIVIQSSLIAVKSAITAGNADIQELIYEASELRTEAKIWQSLNTDDGITVSNSRWGDKGDPITKVADFKYADAQYRLKSIQCRLDSIQDLLDAHNHTVTISVSDKITQLI